MTSETVSEEEWDKFWKEHTKQIEEVDMERPRLSVELSDEQAARLRKALDWGEQGTIFRKIVDDFLIFVETHGKVGLACYMTDRISLLQIMEAKEKENGPKKSKAKSPRTDK
jgi:hypothetical protein